MTCTFYVPKRLKPRLLTFEAAVLNEPLSRWRQRVAVSVDQEYNHGEKDDSNHTAGHNDADGVRRKLFTGTLWVQ
jgi:hypothetical protein